MWSSNNHSTLKAHPLAAAHMRAVAPVSSTACTPLADVRSCSPRETVSPFLQARKRCAHALELSMRVTEAETPMCQSQRYVNLYTADIGAVSVRHFDRACNKSRHQEVARAEHWLQMFASYRSQPPLHFFCTWCFIHTDVFFVTV